LELSVLSVIGCFSYLGVVFAVPFLCFFVSMLMLMSGVASVIIGWFAGIAALLALVYTAVRGIEFQKEQNKVKRDLAAERLALAEGYLTYRNGNYEFQAGSTLLRVPGERGGMTPGIRYRVYYLPESLVALSAQPVNLDPDNQMDNDLAQQGLTEILSQALGYALPGLEANRRGELAADQRRALRPAILRAGSMALFSALLAGYLFYLLLASPGRGDVGWWLAMLLVAGCGGYFVIKGFTRLRRALLDLNRKQVIWIDGIGSKVLVRTSSPSGRTSSARGVSYSYQIGKMRFSTPARLIAAMIDGLRYRAYFTPQSETLVAIEPLESPLKRVT